ncbi:MAG: hypothetical protein P8X93_04930 [Gammaproteobacteria bacterium]
MMKKHWLYTDEGCRTVWRIGLAVLAITVIVEWFVSLHPYFTIEKVFAFHAIFGFLSCVAMVLFAKVLGFFIKRRDDYYDQ